MRVTEYFITRAMLSLRFYFEADFCLLRTSESCSRKGQKVNGRLQGLLRSNGLRIMVFRANIDCSDWGSAKWIVESENRKKMVLLKLCVYNRYPCLQLIRETL